MKGRSKKGRQSEFTAIRDHDGQNTKGQNGVKHRGKIQERKTYFNNWFIVR